MNYEAWLATVPAAITGDSLWKMAVYRYALFASDIGWHDVTRLMRDARTQELSEQLYRALGSIGANLAEGYSRGTGKDRARFYEYALGSARESRDWYYKARHVLGEKIAAHRMGMAAEMIKLLLTMIPEQRFHGVRLSQNEGDGSSSAQEEWAAYPDTGASGMEIFLASVPRSED